VSESSDQTKRETILVVDDEAEVRSLVREILQLNGYTVIDTGDPIEARRIAESQPIHLLLTDVVMPIMNGVELAKRVEAVSPTTKILLMSGYETSAVKGSGRVLIPKPFKSADLIKAIRQLLDSKSAFRRPGPPTSPTPGFGPLAIVLGALLLLAGPAAAAPAAPAFTLTLLDGSGHFDSRAHLGKHVLVVRFQASWCKVCNEEAAAFERVYRKYRASGVEMVSVQVQDTEADARHFLEANKGTYPAGLDPRLKVANRFGFRGTPYTVVINKRGEMVARIHGRADETRLSRILDPIVKRAPPAKAPPAKAPTRSK
jgi:CheY-like chemotaxis protein/peroxiredoxin